MRRRALVIGVSNYHSKKLEQLSFCRNDGNSLYQMLKSVGYDIPEGNNLVGNVSWEKMRKTILDFFDNPSVLREDTLIFYYSGHGVPDIYGDLYLATSEIDPASPFRAGFPFSELTKMAQLTAASKIILILDCCYSGAVRISKGREDYAAQLGSAAVDNKFKSRSMSEGEGICLLAASQAYQEASGLVEEKHSIFTSCLLRGLSGKERDVFDRHGNITADTLSNYVDKKIRSLPPGKRLKQTPIRKIESSGDIIIVDRVCLSELRKHEGSLPQIESIGKPASNAQLIDQSILKSSSLEEVQILIDNGKNATTHPAKLIAFSTFIENVYGVGIEELISGIERKVGSKILGMRGSIDLLFSYVILEFKTDFKNELDDGKTNLIKYFQSLLENDPEAKYVGIITDCIQYASFVPEISNNQVTGLNELEKTKDITSMDPKEVILWIDSFLFSRSGLKPTALDLKVRFGPGSPTHRFAINELNRLRNIVETDTEVQLKMNLWVKNMRIVYGSEPLIESFTDHTYLVTIVKILVYLRLRGSTTIDSEEITDVLTGNYFVSNGILNLIEEDYFSWILSSNIMTGTLQLGKTLANELRRYDLAQVEEDLFKEIYQTIVSQGQRHRTGEYYTPEWLSEIIINESLKFWFLKNTSFPRIFDPACGSGTFLTNAIHILKNHLRHKSDDKMLDVILNNIVGMDINPVAAIIAKSNYILALNKEHIQIHKQITIPVYACDSLYIPPIIQTFVSNIPAYDIEANGSHFQIPVRIASDPSLLGKLLSVYRDALEMFEIKKRKSDSFAILNNLSTIVDENELKVIELTLGTLLGLAEKNLDSVWIFIMRNVYAPILLKERKFDLIVGNPPWIAMRSIQSRTYQDFLKSLIFSYALLEEDNIKLFTHMEMATLFFCRSADLYLEDGGIISFLMPISVITAALHHHKFKRFDHPKQKLIEILSFENIPCIFSLPVCAIITKKEGSTKYPVDIKYYKGKIIANRRNAKLSELSPMSIINSKFNLPQTIQPGQYSFYYDKFKEGASLTPRNFWFVSFEVNPKFIDLDNPLVETSHESIAVSKEEWKGSILKKNVEADYVYSTVLGKDLIPFGHIKLRPLISPLIPQSNDFKLLNVDELRSRGSWKIAKWVETCQKYWEQIRTEKSAVNYPLVIDRLNYSNLLTVQNPSKGYVVIYNMRGANAFAHVIDKFNLPNFKLDSFGVMPKQFVADTTDCFYETNDRLEAHYLSSMLNSDPVNKRVKPFQPRGKYGYRDIGRRPLMLPIPKFNSQVADHVTLASLSVKCHKTIKNHNFVKKGFKGKRNEALKLLSNDLQQINVIAQKLLI